MNKLDIYYRAYKDFNKETSSSNEIKKDISLFSKNNQEDDLLRSTKYRCIIEEDWVNAIEEGLVYIEKAVNEDRQFIRTNGEIVEIEKAKKISKQSVEHLAKHSNFITHVSDNPNDNIVPDKIYMVEKLSDYAIYENRFLYMVLKYLETFISFRLTKIQELRSTYIGKLSLHKNISLDKKKLTLDLSLDEKLLNNPFPLKDQDSSSLVKRISNCNEIIQSLLSTDLMVNVSKSPMIKPPITITNVLKMNNNFKNALALYNYIASYTKDGYTFEEVTTDYHPFKNNVAFELYNNLNLLDFLSYKIGNELDEYLEKNYQEQELILKKEEEKKLLDQIASLKRRASENENTMIEYMLLLEKRNNMLEKSSQDLIIAKKEIISLNEKIASLNNQIVSLNNQVEELNNSLFEKVNEINSLKENYIQEKERLIKSYEEQIELLKSNHQNEIETLKNSYQEEITSLKSQHEEEISRVNVAFEKEKEELNEKLISTNDELIKEKSSHEEDKNNLNYKLDLAYGELDAIRFEKGELIPSSEYTQEKRFKELEKRQKAFNKFFNEQWKLTKKAIRKEILPLDKNHLDKK